MERKLREYLGFNQMLDCKITNVMRVFLHFTRCRWCDLSYSQPLRKGHGTRSDVSLGGDGIVCKGGRKAFGVCATGVASS